MDINILKEEDFDGILWDANDEVDDKVLSSEINNGPQQEIMSNKNEGQRQSIRTNSISSHGDQHSRLLSIDCSVPTLPLPSSNLDLSTQRVFPSIDMEDTLEHPFLNSFVSTLAEKSSSQDASSNVLNSSTGLPLFPPATSSTNNDGSNAAMLNEAHNLNNAPPTQARGTVTALTINDYENMLLPPNYLTSWEPGNNSSQSATQNNVTGGNKNNNIPSILPQQNTQQIHKAHNISDNDTITNSVSKTATKSKASKKKQKLSGEKAQVPPFFLFDAPVELRHNFTKAQQAQNLPATIQDSNSFHYGLAVNSFQPMIKYKDSRVKSLATLNAVDDIVNPHGKRVKLLDARQKKSKRGNDRNEREQQRAQKITELIDKLRLTMVQNGWKVEMKSKYQILSTCGEYLNHLKSITKEKEEKLEKTKADLALRQQKLKEEQGSQGSRSDPESVTSSLTAFSTNSSNIVTNSSDDPKKSDQNKSNPSQSAQSESSSDKPNQLQSEASSDKPNPSQSEASSGQNPKKQCIDDGSGTSSESGHKGAHIAVNKMSSSISDMTDSNKGSSDGKTSTETELKPTLVTSSEGCSQRSGEVEVSSTAAVVSGIGSQKHGHTHADVVVKTGPRPRKRKRHHEPTSLDDDFVLNYQEVFITSNVPQIISTLAGRIIISNDCFYRITGISHQQMKRITLFSLIQTEKLSKFYELVAESLAESNQVVDGSEVGSNTAGKHFFKTMTLPCIKFTPRNDSDSKFSLFMNVCFIWNENPVKRCFHCAFYDKICESGDEGCISSEMLNILDL